MVKIEINLAHDGLFFATTAGIDLPESGTHQNFINAA